MGLVVQKVVQKDGLLRLMTPERVRPGTKVYLTGSTALAKKAQDIISSAKTQIALDLNITWQEGTPLLQARLDDGRSVQVKAAFKMEKAKNQPITRQQIESQMRRMGGTPFVVRKISMDYAEDLFAPLGALNQLRRDLLEKVQETLLEKWRPTKEKVENARNIMKEMNQSASAASTSAAPGSAVSRRPSLAIYADSLETVRGAIEGGCRRVYFEPVLGEETKDRAIKIEKMIEEAKAICGDAERMWKWPKITHTDFFKFAGPLLAAVMADGIMVENVGALQAALDARLEAHLYGASGLNVCNHLTVQALSPPLELLTLSPELSARQLARTVAAARLSPDAPRMELMVQGNLEVMVAEDCMPLLAKVRYDPREFWGLQDMRRIFPLRLDDELRTHIFNSAETCLLDLMPEIFTIGLDGVAVDARGRTREYAREMTVAYKEAIDLTDRGEGTLLQDLQDLTESIRPLTLGGITHGHFVKGLKDELS
jgi:putative protease